MTIKIKRLHEEAILPKYSRKGDAGLDLYSVEDLVLGPQSKGVVGTGIAMAIPEYHVGLIWDRSGVASNYDVIKKAGVIDSNYRGEVRVLLHNLSNEAFEIKKGMKIAQMIIQKYEEKEILEVEDLDETIRGKKGFGSSGLY